MGKRLYVGNLPYDADEASLRATFGTDGRTVERVHIVLDRETQRPRGFAFVEMATEEQARQAIAALDGTLFGTRQLRVTEAEERRPAGPGGPRGPGGPGGPPRADRPPAGGAPRFAGGAGGPSGGGSPRTVDDPARGNRFGPDARPRREREQEAQRRAPRRRTEGESEDYGGRRGYRRFEDDDEE
ncbi:MAG: RNA-binding protein [Planctomycetes bacterium]|nr:RNA-binding protein [Planctomycetota bacterium]